MHLSSKTYPHSEGLSCCFRQWRAIHSHCQYLHGYALKLEFQFVRHRGAGRLGGLDERNWVMDFGGLKELRERLHETFDHKTIIAKDDPMMEYFCELGKAKLIQLVIMEHVGCEWFAREAYNIATNVLFKTDREVYVDRVTVWEHEGNSATYINPEISRGYS